MRVESAANDDSVDDEEEEDELAISPPPPPPDEDDDDDDDEAEHADDDGEEVAKAAPVATVAVGSTLDAMSICRFVFIALDRCGVDGSEALEPAVEAAAAAAN